MLSRLVDLAINAEHYRANFTATEQVEAIDLLVVIMEAGKERPFERGADEVYPLDNGAFVHE